MHNKEKLDKAIILKDNNVINTNTFYFDLDK